MTFNGSYDDETSKYEFQIINQLTFMMYIMLRCVHIWLDDFELEPDIRQMMWQVYSELSILYQPVFQLLKDLTVERMVMGSEGAEDAKAASEDNNLQDGSGV